jgi:hypothetical protein
MKKLVLMAVLLTVSGCATTQQPQPLPVEVKVPVAVSCIKPEQIPAKPDYESLKDNNNTPDGTVVLHIARDFAKSLPYQQELEALIETCR